MIQNTYRNLGLDTLFGSGRISGSWAPEASNAGMYVCGAHELSYYNILMRRAKTGYVCMYTSINIVSRTVSF